MNPVIKLFKQVQEGVDGRRFNFNSRWSWQGQDTRIIMEKFGRPGILIEDVEPGAWGPLNEHGRQIHPLFPVLQVEDNYSPASYNFFD